MSKIFIKTITGNEGDEIDLPQIFETEFRPDLIKRAVLSEQSKQRQPQGRSPLAGRLVAASSVGPGRGISLVPRTHGRGTHHGHRGAFVPSTRGGRLAHPPTTEKVIIEQINKREYAKALYSAVAATAMSELITARGHILEEEIQVPIVVEDRFTEILKTKEVVQILENLGLGKDLVRIKKKGIRSGKGKMRGRKYKRRKGPLIVVSEECDLIRATRNIPGVDICTLKELSIEKLAPGTSAGRVTVWTESAFRQLKEWK